MYKSKFLTSFAALAFATTASCLTVTPSNDATALANALLGGSSGITLVSATYTGAADGSGLYTAGPQGITDSIVLTTGDAVDVIPSDDTTDTQISKSKGTAGSALCESINGGVATYDAAVLSLNVILSSGYTGFASQYIFATEEYPEWVGSDFNDAFGVWVDGKQIAVDSTGAPITVSGPYFQSSAVLTPPASGSSMDGSTPILMSTYAAAPGAHKIDIAICDTADSLLDSAVFVALRAVPGTNTTSSSSSSIVSSSSTVSSSSSVITSSSIVSSSSSIYANTTIVAPTSSSSSIYVSPSSSIIPSSSSSSIHVSPSSSIIPSSSSSSSYVNTISSIIPTSSSSYSNATITGAPTSSVEPPCVTYTSYIVKTITLCDTSCYPTTTLVPTVVTSTLQLTVYTPCSTVTVSQCTGGPGSPCVTYTNTITYPAITTYPPIPTFTAPVGPASTPSGVPVGPASTPSGIPVGPASTPSGVPVSPASTPSGVPVGPGSHSSPVPVGPASSPNGPVYTAPVTYTAPAVPTTPVVLPTYTAPASVPYGNGTHGCPGGANCAHPTPSAGFSIPVSNGTSTVHPTTIVPVKSSAPATSAPAVKPTSPSTTAPPSFTGAASRVGMTSGVVVGLVVAVLAAL